MSDTAPATRRRLIESNWDGETARGMSDLDLLRYRSNLLGADLRITNFGGGNTSAKYDATDPFTGKPTAVMAVKGSGGDLGSIRNTGFALLYLDRLEQLISVYRGEAHEDEMVAFYPSCAFNNNTVPASIDTPLHAFLPFRNVDHLHPDWTIALAASANGREKMEEFNRRYGHKLVWLPWQRPGFELGLMLRRAIEQNSGTDGIILGSHGLFTWGDSSRDCYENSLAMLNDLGDFVIEHEKRAKEPFGGLRYGPRDDRSAVAVEVLPVLRGKLGTTRRSIAHFEDSAEVLEFIDSAWGSELAALGTSCPDHFVRTRIAPLLVEWDPSSGVDALPAALDAGLARYREEYIAYYNAHAEPGSPALRDPNPSVVLIPGIGMFSFGRSRKEARISGEFYANAIRVMRGATALEEHHGAALPEGFTALHNYVALPRREAFHIEYWALEEAKLQRMPPEKRFSRRIFLIAGGASGIGRATALKLAGESATLMIADRNLAGARETMEACARIADAESFTCCELDLRHADSMGAAVRATVLRYGGIDGVINTAAVFISPRPEGWSTQDLWRFTLDVNVTGNFLLVDAVRPVFQAQGLSGVIVLTSSANAVVPKHGSEAYDVSKTAVNHLIGELAVSLAPLIRVNGIAPATVVSGSDMFPKERVIASLRKYGMDAAESEDEEALRNRLAEFYAQRTLTRQPVRPSDCAEAIAWLAAEDASRTTGHIIPVDGGLSDAFLR